MLFIVTIREGVYGRLFIYRSIEKYWLTVQIREKWGWANNLSGRIVI